MKYLKKFNESFNESVIEITEEQAYTLSEGISDFPSSTVNDIESIELDGVELVIRDDEMSLSHYTKDGEKYIGNSRTVELKVINLIEINGGLRGNTKWTISMFHINDGFYVCVVDKHKWKGSWTLVTDKRSYYKCTLDGLLELVSDSEDWF